MEEPDDAGKVPPPEAQQAPEAEPAARFSEPQQRGRRKERSGGSVRRARKVGALTRSRSREKPRLPLLPKSLAKTTAKRLPAQPELAEAASLIAEACTVSAPNVNALRPSKPATEPPPQSTELARTESSIAAAATPTVQGPQPDSKPATEQESPQSLPALVRSSSSVGSTDSNTGTPYGTPFTGLSESGTAGAGRGESTEADAQGAGVTQEPEHVQRMIQFTYQTHQHDCRIGQLTILQDTLEASIPATIATAVTAAFEKSLTKVPQMAESSHERLMSAAQAASSSTGVSIPLRIARHARGQLTSLGLHHSLSHIIS